MLPLHCGVYFYRRAGEFLRRLTLDIIPNSAASRLFLPASQDGSAGERAGEGEDVRDDALFGRRAGEEELFREGEGELFRRAGEAAVLRMEELLLRRALLRRARVKKLMPACARGW